MQFAHQPVESFETSRHHHTFGYFGLRESLPKNISHSPYSIEGQTKCITRFTYDYSAKPCQHQSNNGQWNYHSRLVL
ncbi:hypothetical protein BH11VER1_BH11VER1_41430 [soil metagenome]